MNIVEKYCEDVISGRIVTCEFTRLAVERHLRDLDDGINRGLFFDKKAGLKAIKFFDFLRFTQGRQFYGNKFELTPSQSFIQYVLYGWKNADGYRRFNYAYIEVPRKYGKTTYAAANGIFLMDADGEAGAEIFAVATKEDQARKCFTEASNLVKSSPFLSKSVKVLNKSIFNEATYSFFKPLGSDKNTNDSHNPHGVIVDEYHAHKDDGMVNVMKSGMGSRKQPLMFMITTAGFNKNGPCYMERDVCVKILRGILNQDNKFVMIFTLDEGDDWNDEKTWIKAQPHLGTTVELDFMRKEYIDAKNNPTRENNFKTKNLNIWTSEEISWINDDVWCECNSGLKLDDIWGRPCFAGLDIASHVDLNALALFFYDKKPYDLYVFYWCPVAKVMEEKDGVNYCAWERDGWIKTSPGNIVDVDLLTSDILNILHKVDCQRFAFDPAKAFTGVMQNLMKEFPVEFFRPFRQGFISMDTPTKEFEKMVISKNLNHGGNPVMRWNISNVVLRTDPAGNIKIDKGKSKNKVDGAVASVMAIGEFMTPQEESINDLFLSKIKEGKPLI